jgi:hypothetical protein
MFPDLPQSTTPEPLSVTRKKAKDACEALAKVGGEHPDDVWSLVVSCGELPSYAYENDGETLTSKAEIFNECLEALKLAEKTELQRMLKIKP